MNFIRNQQNFIETKDNNEWKLTIVKTQIVINEFW